MAKITTIRVGSTDNQICTSEAFTITLSVAGWSNKKQTISNSKFVTSGYSYTVSPASGSLKEYAKSMVYADDVTTAGKITFNCEEVPATALAVNITRTVVL